MLQIQRIYKDFMKPRLTRALRTQILALTHWASWVLSICCSVSHIPDRLPKKLATWNDQWVQAKWTPTKACFSLPKRLEKGSLARQKTFRKQLLYRKKLLSYPYSHLRRWTKGLAPSHQVINEVPEQQSCTISKTKMTELRHEMDKSMIITENW